MRCAAGTEVAFWLRRLCGVTSSGGVRVHGKQPSSGSAKGWPGREEAGELAPRLWRAPFLPSDAHTGGPPGASAAAGIPAASTRPMLQACRPTSKSPEKCHSTPSESRQGPEKAPAPRRRPSRRRVSRSEPTRPRASANHQLAFEGVEWHVSDDFQVASHGGATGRVLAPGMPAAALEQSGSLTPIFTADCARR